MFERLKAFFAFKREIGKKGFMENLTGFAWGIVTFAIIVGIGIVVLNNFGNQNPGTVNSTMQTIIGNLGTSSGGLSTWIPTIIVVVVAALIIGLLALRGSKGRY